MKKLLKAYLLPFLSLSTIFATGCNKKIEIMEDLEDSVVDASKYSINEDFYESIIEIKIKHEESVKLKEYSPSDFHQFSFSFVSNYKVKRTKNVDDEYRTTLVAVISSPSKQNIINAIEALKNNPIVYDANPVYIPHQEGEYETSMLDWSYDGIFNKNREQSTFNHIDIISRVQKDETEDGNMSRLTIDSFPEIEIDQSKPFSCSYQSDWSRSGSEYFYWLVTCSLKDESLINIKESFLELRSNPNVKAVSYGADGHAC